MVHCTADQQKAFDLVTRLKQSLFISGPAGTGKSFLINKIRTWANNIGRNCGVTAATGNAAVLLSGRTLHSFLGIGLATASAEILAQQNMKKSVKLRKLHMLIIDEISMISDELLDKVSVYLGLIRKKPDTPFGGLQMIFVGDPCQLPPINGNFFFHSSEWKKLNPTHVQLTTIVRQENDPEFRDLLNRLRWGKCTTRDEARLQECQSTTFPEWLRPTRLFALNVSVDSINAHEFDKLLASNRDLGAPAPQTYPAVFSNARAAGWAKSSGIPESITLAPNAQVVVTYNVDQAEGIVNGTRGVVIDLTELGVTIRTTSGSLYPIGFCDVKNDEDPSILVRFLPIKLAYALTIHKSQGMTLDAVELDLGSSIFEYGQAYTALSRTRDLKSIKITNIRRKSFRTHPDVLAFYAPAAPPAPPAPPTAPPAPIPIS